MKNFLEYYYNLLNITVHEKNNNYYFEYNHKTYAFIYTNRSISEINAIYKLNQNLKNYHQIILNRNNSPITYYNGKQYVLLKLNKTTEKITYLDLKRNEVVLNKELEVLLRNQWVDLLEKKIDYLEYQREHLKDQYRVLDESLDYFIGLTENAISYLNHTFTRTRKTELDTLVISHRRIANNSKITFYNPLNIVIDHQARDISKYLKYLFLEDIYDRNTINDIIRNIPLSNYGYQLLFGRMLYPSFYFDIYERIINNQEDEKSIYKIIKRTTEYEEYLKTIYQLINYQTKIPSIDWI